MISKLSKNINGITVKKNKKHTENKAIEQATIPRKMMFPMNMHIGKPAEVIVSIGDQVQIGTLIGRKSGMISSNIHSSVSGKVISVEEREISGKYVNTVVIENDFKDTWYLNSGLIECRSSEQLIEKVRVSGIVGLGGATFPTDVKLMTSKNKTFNHLIINGAECEPFVTADRRIIIEKSEELIRGITLIYSFLEIEEVYIAIEKNSNIAKEVLNEKLLNYPKIKLKELPDSYPQGAEKTLTKSVLGKEIPAGKLPIDIETLIINISTVFAIYQSVFNNRQLIERVVTVSGSPIKEPKNLLVRIGTSVQSIIEDCGNFIEPVGKLINGGPMMGKIISNLNEPVTKGTSLILALNQEESQVSVATNCIKCSQCITVCPINLQPILISQAYENKNFKEAEDLGALNCIDCGACSFICPSKIDILGNIKAAKSEILKRRESVK